MLGFHRRFAFSERPATVPSGFPLGGLNSEESRGCVAHNRGASGNSARRGPARPPGQQQELLQGSPFGSHFRDSLLRSKCWTLTCSGPLTNVVWDTITREFCAACWVCRTQRSMSFNASRLSAKFRPHCSRNKRWRFRNGDGRGDQALPHLLDSAPCARYCSQTCPRRITQFRQPQSLRGRFAGRGLPQSSSRAVSSLETALQDRHITIAKRGERRSREHRSRLMARIEDHAIIAARRLPGRGERRWRRSRKRWIVAAGEFITLHASSPPVSTLTCESPRCRAVSAASAERLPSEPR